MSFSRWHTLSETRIANVVLVSLVAGLATAAGFEANVFSLKVLFPKACVIDVRL